MDAKMSEAEQTLRRTVGRTRPSDDIEVAPSMKVADWKALLSELDRLREFERDVREVQRYSRPENCGHDLRHLLAKLDRARATGDEGT